MKLKYPQFPLVHSPFRSFFILLMLATISGLGAVYISNNFSEVEIPAQTVPHKTAIKNVDVQVPAVDTSNWKKFTDSIHGLSFSYPPNWKVATYPSSVGWYIIVLKPDAKFDHVRIYISPDKYFALEGLPTKPDNLAGMPALNVNNMLVGAKFAGQYYTFDMGTSLAVQPQFRGILQTVAFAR